jgi:hypothetical protein
MIALVDAYAASNVQGRRIYVYTDPLKTTLTASWLSTRPRVT